MVDAAGAFPEQVVMRGVRKIEWPLAGSRPIPEDAGTRLAFRAIWRTPLPGARGKFQFRFFNRVVLSLLRGKLLNMRGAGIIHDYHKPYVLVANHSLRYEAVLLLTLVNHLREGHPIHFLADWNYRLWPLIGHLMVLAESITVVRKPAKPAFLNVFKPLFTDDIAPLEKARLYLEQGEPVGIFPEGTRNPNPSRMLLGDRGAAWLSLQAGVPVLPVGIRFPGVPPSGHIVEWTPLEIEFGNPLFPSARLEGRASDLDAVKEWHETIMMEISRLCRKEWNPKLRRKKHESD